MVACCKKEQVMSETECKNFTGAFKAKVALETIRGTKTDMDGRGRALDNSSNQVT